MPKTAPKKNLSALKRSRQAEKREERNRAIKSSLKTLGKRVETAVSAKDAVEAKRSLIETISAWDKAVSKGTVQRNTASRKIARLTRRVNAIPVGAKA